MRLVRNVLPTLALVLTMALTSQAAGPDPAKMDASVKKAVAFLRTAQADDGSWTSPQQPGITALVVHSLLQQGVSADDPTVAKGLKHLESHKKPDGGIYFETSTQKNYETAISLQAFESAGAKYRPIVDDAVKFLKKLQWDEEETMSKEHTSFGGAGYGRSSRPDLSNTTFFIDALKSAGVSSSDPAMQNALVFVSRCQNLKSEHNQTDFAGKVNDGGFYYTIAAGGSSVAGANEDGGLRSYASMTYAGLKSMIHAGLTPTDPRVAAAEKWIKQHYSLTENPGLGDMGLYYYYQTFGKTLSVLGWAEFTDAAGVKHDWKKDLAEALITRQKENGSWVNTAARFMETDPNLVTAYGLMALKHCK